jgi:hypothetical protein
LVPAPDHHNDASGLHNDHDRRGFVINDNDSGAHYYGDGCDDDHGGLNDHHQRAGDHHHPEYLNDDLRTRDDHDDGAVQHHHIVYVAIDLDHFDHRAANDDLHRAGYEHIYDDQHDLDYLVNLVNRAIDQYNDQHGPGEHDYGPQFDHDDLGQHYLNVVTAPRVLNDDDQHLIHDLLHKHDDLAHDDHDHDDHDSAAAETAPPHPA